MSFSDLWKTVKKMDSGVSHLKKEYDLLKKKKQELSIKGKRSLFFQAVEYRIPFVNFREIKQPIIQSVDGIHVIDRISCEVYRDTQDDPALGVGGADVSTGQRIRETLIKTPQGFMTPRIAVNDGFDVAGNYNESILAAFDFEWRLEIGSNERSYCVDAFDGLSFMSSDTLVPGLDGELELFKPYAIRGNESWTITVKPTLFPVLSLLDQGDNMTARTDDVYIVSIYTVGHKIIGSTS